MIFTIFYKYIKLLGRLFRPCKPDKLKITNTHTNHSLDKPLSIVTWNIQGLFCYLSDLKIKNIIKSLHTFNQDIICLQEVFEDSLKQIIIQKLSYKYPYYLCGNINKKYIIGEDSGLLILSKYKIKFIKEILLQDNYFPDKMANKSILYFKVGCLNLVNTHLQSSYMYNIQDISAKQIKLLIKESPFVEFIITGDLNNNNGFDYCCCEKNNHNFTWNNQILDYILPIKYSNLSIQTKVSDIDITNTSDHNPLCAMINYES